jgi:hypothetical protein
LGSRYNVRTNASLSSAIVAVIAKNLVAIRERLPDYMDNHCICGSIFAPFYCPIAIYMVDSQEGWIAFAAALTCPSIVGK